MVADPSGCGGGGGGCLLLMVAGGVVAVLTRTGELPKLKAEEEIHLLPLLWLLFPKGNSGGTLEVLLLLLLSLLLVVCFFMVEFVVVEDNDDDDGGDCDCCRIASNRSWHILGTIPLPAEIVVMVAAVADAVDAVLVLVVDRLVAVVGVTAVVVGVEGGGSKGGSCVCDGGANREHCKVGLLGTEDADDFLGVVGADLLLLPLPNPG